ncbi:GNAT family N-acetyltransferase [Rubrivirga sp. S365]|uniref:GNAT family N-acetyltransferase n=1 Tax=Rubrivirga litoralis TaxID=3075598 RepID=A0ABU3BS60_9BACT|nr:MULTISPECIES: GNAT family N-acetyltransferase [unclassified Rubrivirga]MDT0632126.1 GNAT family N-acetyltransferase [Rubrivirga sp. F394]MDT7857017.1 GNAT family N-acetyltransferase [Rubrivirga sp. S365]
MRGRGPAPPPGPDPFADGLPPLDGDRVRLRAPRPADAADVLAVFGDAGHLRYWSHGPLADLDAARAYVDGIGAGWRERRLFQWAVTEPPDDRLVGTVTLVDWDREHRRAEVGFILHPAYAGRGLATDAVRTALRFAVGAMDLHRVEADVDPENAASLRLLERLGFRREGVLRERWFTFGTWKDSVVLGLLAADLAGGADAGGAG